MKNKVLLILCDGMRPDAVTGCGHPFAEKLLKETKNTMNCKTVMPSVTLPCHMSLFHSVDPTRHGVLTNIYTPQVRPIKGLVDRLFDAGKKSAMIYDWETLRDLSRPGTLSYSHMFHIASGHKETMPVNTDETIKVLNTVSPDFLFFYIGLTDEEGHNFGWMSEKYMKAVYDAWDCIEKVFASLPEDYSVIITADHGGHGRGHGDDIPEDMLIPLMFTDERIDSEKLSGEVSIIDIAPTVAALLGVSSDPDWEGKSLLAEI